MAETVNGVESNSGKESDKLESEEAIQKELDVLLAESDREDGFGNATGWDRKKREPLETHEFGVGHFLNDEGGTTADDVYAIGRGWISWRRGQWYCRFPPDKSYMKADGMVCERELTKILMKCPRPDIDWPVLPLRRCPSFYESEFNFLTSMPRTCTWLIGTSYSC